MADLKPPWLAVGERETLLALLQYQRESFVRKVDGLDEEAAGRRFVGSGTTLLWLAQHLSHAERLWVVERFAGEQGEAPQDDGTLAAAVAAYRQTWARVDTVLDRSPNLDERCRQAPVNLRWVLAHLLEETARHAGHADIIRELIDGETGR